MKALIKGAVALSLVWSCSAWAGVITSPTGFSGGETVLDFETNPVTVPPTGPFSLGPVTFTESSTGSGGPGWRLISVMDPVSRVLTDNAGISDIVLDFSTPFQRVGLDVGIGGATYDVSFYDAALTLLGTVTGTVTTITGAGSEFFAGWESAGGISRVRIVETSGENGLVGGLDNVRFENIGAVPAPAGMALLGLGFVALGFARRRMA